MKKLARMKSREEILALTEARVGIYNRLYGADNSTIDLYQLIDCEKLIEIIDYGHSRYVSNEARNWDIPRWAVEIIPETNFDKI